MRCSIVKSFEQTEKGFKIKTFSHDYECEFEDKLLVLLRIDDEKFNIIYDKYNMVEILDGNKGTIYTVNYPRLNEIVISNVMLNHTWRINISLEDVIIISKEHYPSHLYNIILENGVFTDITCEA